MCSEKTRCRVLPSAIVFFSTTVVFRLRTTTPGTLLFRSGKEAVSDTCAGDDELFSE
jgi:hypothetical protein